MSRSRPHDQGPAAREVFVLCVVRRIGGRKSHPGIAPGSRLTTRHLHAAAQKAKEHWRRIATRYDRCAKTFLSAVAHAASVIF